MAVNPDEDTEFNDALRKHGILPPKEAPPPSPSPPPSPTLDDLLDDLATSELLEVSESAGSDDREREILAYRRQRLEKERKEQKGARFGRVYPIGRDDYTREVTEASKISEEDDEERTGTGVVCFLYKDGIPRSDRAFDHVRNLALRYPRTKFVSIVGDKCISNLPDTRIPMIIIYKGGEILNQITAWGADRERRIEELEAILFATGALYLPERPSLSSCQGDQNDEDEEKEDHDRSSRMRSAATWTNGRPQKNIRNKTRGNGSDSDDFEFDL